jgi:hypothetical protein
MVYYFKLLGFWLAVLAVGVVIVIPTWRRKFRDLFTFGRSTGK